MSENKFIQHLKGKGTAKSIVEIKNQKTPTSFADMPQGTSDASVVYSDHRGNTTVVANGTVNWKLNGSALDLATTVNGNGTDYSSVYNAQGAGLWVNAVYTFPNTGDPVHPVAMVFNPQTKWVLKLCGNNLLSQSSDMVELTLVITIGTTNIISKSFVVKEQANQFCKELVIDFAESNTQLIKAQGESTMRVQVLCGTADASAQIYNGMSVLTLLQRKVEAVAVSNDFANIDEVLQNGMLPSDYFNNATLIDQVEDGEEAYAVFQRDGDTINLSGWTPKDAVAYKDEVIIKSETMPTANANLLGAIYQYVGETTAPYQHGYIYECVEISAGVYGWERIDVQPGGSRGRFLSLWDCVTGLPESTPPISPFEYKSGDYYIVSAVSTATPPVNYKPDGSSYTTGVPSTTVETDEVAVDDTYFYDGTTWKLQSNSNKTVTFSNIAGDIYDNASATTALNAKQDTLVNQSNIKSVNGNSLLGSGNLELSTYLTYPAGWTTNSTTKAFCNDVAADSTASKGKAYLGEVTFSDLPAGIINGEVEVKIVDGTTAADKVIVLTLTSGNVAPYQWQYTYWNGGSNTSGWQTWQEPLVSGTNIKTVNSTSLLGFGDITIDGLPTQTGNNGKLLTTDGSTPSWTEIKTINSGSLLGSGNIDVLVNEATATNALGVGYTTINTTYNDSINIGNASQVLANNAIALGAFASAEGQDSIAIYSSTGTAHRARTTHTGNIAIGYNALAINAAYTIAIGYNAYAQGLNSIQLGTGNVASQNTFQVWTYPMLNKTTGLIPAVRLADQTSATQGQVLTLDSNLDATWATPTASVAWGEITGTLSDQTDLNNALDAKANTDMNNLTSTGANIGNWSSNVTNCITNIPQDIKLELSSGTLTLYPSKVYVPNGSGVFDVMTSQSQTITMTTNGTYFLCINANTGYIQNRLVANSVSGAGATTTSGFAYNTTTNQIRFYDSGGVDQGYNCSFPIAIITVSGGVITSIDKVFNGFGYIGTAWFMLPNVKGLVPNGLNDDGTYKSIEFTNPSVYVYTPAAETKRTVGVEIDTSGNITNVLNGQYKNVYSGTTLPTTVSDTLAHYYYKTDENQWYITSGSTTASWSKFYPFYAGTRTDNGTTTSEFIINPTFRADDSNLVHLAGAETITGIKTIGTSAYLIKKHGSKPDGTNHYSTIIEAHDVDGNIVGYYRNLFDTSNSIHTDIMAHRIIGSTDYYSTVGAVVTSSGVTYGTAPASAVNGSIVTTVNKSKTQNGYFKLGNGMIVQWGTYTVSAQNGTGTITLPTAFSSTNYSVVTTAKKNTDGVQLSIITSQTSSQFSYRNYAYASMPILWIAVGY